MQDSSTVSVCPSFSFYASVEFADAVKRNGDSRSGYIDPDLYSVKVDGNWEDDVDFEFITPQTTPVHEDNLLFFPAKPYDAAVQSKHDENDAVVTAGDTSRNLFLEEWNIHYLSSSSLSSSESDNQKNFPARSYSCLGSPLRFTMGGGRSKSISKETPSGASKRWRFKDLLLRRSDGGVGTSTFTNGNEREKKKKEESSTSDKRKDKTTSYNVKIVAQGDKRRRSYLPYRQDLIGVLAAMKRLCH